MWHQPHIIIIRSTLNHSPHSRLLPDRPIRSGDARSAATNMSVTRFRLILSVRSASIRHLTLRKSPSPTMWLTILQTRIPAQRLRRIFRKLSPAKAWHATSTPTSLQLHAKTDSSRSPRFSNILQPTRKNTPNCGARLSAVSVRTRP